MAFKKLKDINQFTFKKFNKRYWFKWDEANKKSLRSESPQAGYKVVYEVLIENDDTLSLSQDQLGQMLVATFKDGTANVVNRTFLVKTNGKTGLDIRYFLNLMNPNSPASLPPKEEISLDAIPF